MTDTIMASKTKFSKLSLSGSGKLAASIIFCIVSVVGTYAQNPVSWSLITTKSVKAGAKLDARLSADISGGWHLYSLSQSADGPNATRIDQLILYP